jgi:hypothetical protein
MTSPTQRSLTLLRRSGHLAAVVETWIPHVNRGRDLFGFADVLALHPVRREVVLVQITTADHLAARLAKVRAAVELPGVLAAGCRVQVHGWCRVGGCWRVRVIEVEAADTEPAVVVDLPQRRRGAWQRGLFDGVSV